MQQILAAGAPFTPVLASNDLSCLGAVEVLRLNAQFRDKYRDRAKRITVFWFDPIGATECFHI